MDAIGKIRGRLGPPSRTSAFPALEGCGGRTSTSGFTLVELLIATFLLSVGVLAVAQVLAVADRHTAAAREETIAVSLVQEIREKMLCQDFSDVVTGFNGVDTNVPGSVTAPAQLWAQHIQAELGHTGRGTIQVLTPAQDNSIAAGMLDATVTVSWSERGQAVSIPMRFVIADTNP